MFCATKLLSWQIFVATNTCLEKHNFVATSLLLSRQKYACRDKIMFVATKRHPDGSSPASCEVHTEQASGTSCSQRIAFTWYAPERLFCLRCQYHVCNGTKLPCPCFDPCFDYVIISSSANGAGLLRNVLLNETPKFHYISCSLGVLACLGVLWHSPNRAITSLLLFACYNVIHEASGVRWTDCSFPKGLWKCATKEGT